MPNFSHFQTLPGLLCEIQISLYDNQWVINLNVDWFFLSPHRQSPIAIVFCNLRLQSIYEFIKGLMLWVQMRRCPTVSLFAEGAILRRDFTATIMMEFLEIQRER